MANISEQIRMIFVQKPEQVRIIIQKCRLFEKICVSASSAGGVLIMVVNDNI